MALGGEAGLGGATVISQTVALVGSWAPTLGFWYRPAQADPEGDRFQVLVEATWQASNGARKAGLVPGPADAPDRLAGQEAVTATYAITNAILPFIREMAGRGVSEAARRDRELARGVNVYRGRLINARVAASFHRRHEDLDTLLEQEARTME